MRDGVRPSLRGLPRAVRRAHRRVGDERRTLLFDVGPYADVWLANAGRLGIDLATIDTVFLSHWHWDHSGALPAVVAAIAAARAEAGITAPSSSTSTPTDPTSAAP